jgi:MoxR-like ATPase
MNSAFFRAKSNGRTEVPVHLPRAIQMDAAKPEDYIADQGLVDAVNTALLLGQPLLLTGEPGTGKTQLASALAHQLGYGRPLRFEAKSTSQARDLFYHYDSIGHFRAKDVASPLPFINYAALGKAVLFAHEPGDVQHLMPPGLQHPGPSSSVVLIDEVDKAPRDFPNDILVELEELSFRIPELDASLRAPDTRRPVVVITSNSERDLPDAFLRRCVYYDIPFPSPKTLRSILERRLTGLDGARHNDDFITAALDFFQKLRDLPDLRRKPATAELIAWISALRRAYPGRDNPLTEKQALLEKLGVLVKTRDDLGVARRSLNSDVGAG